MKRLYFFVLLFALVGWVSAQSTDGQPLPDSLRVKTMLRTPLQPSEDLTGTPILEIPAGEEVWVLEAITRDVCKVRYYTLVGYVNLRYLAGATPPLRAAFEGSGGNSGGGSATGGQGSTDRPGCPSVQCSGTTQKGLRCRNVTKSCNGRCHYHGG
jgi:hypothetical protein